MKVQLETITNQKDQSFSLMFNPRLSDLYFWHFHPEYELVYIEAKQGRRLVGEHSSIFWESDLVLIGSNIPHLNFDYGIQEDYRKVVVHLKKEFVEQKLAVTPEFRNIQSLMQNASKGMAFKGVSKKRIGTKLFDMEQLTPFQQFLQLLDILNDLAAVREVELLHNTPVLNTFTNRERERLQVVHSFVDQHYGRRIELQEIANLCFMTKEAFCRYFKRITKHTFIDFLNRYRISQSKRLLLEGKTVSDACFQSGFESLSYYNRIFKRVTGENPSNFRRRNLELRRNFVPR